MGFRFSRIKALQHALLCVVEYLSNLLMDASYRTQKFLSRLMRANIWRLTESIFEFKQPENLRSNKFGDHHIARYNV